VVIKENLKEAIQLINEANRILESNTERMQFENEAHEMLKLTSTINPVLKEVWDNEKDAVYDEL